MAWQKGQSGNPSGLTVLQARTRRMVEGLGPKAVLRLEQLMSSENEGVALGAAKEILARVAPPPKNGNLSIDVTHSASPHLAALVGMAAQTMARVQSVPENHMQTIDITANPTNHLVLTQAAPLAIEGERDDE